MSEQTERERLEKTLTQLKRHRAGAGLYRWVRAWPKVGQGVEYALLFLAVVAVGCSIILPVRLPQSGWGIALSLTVGFPFRIAVAGGLLALALAMDDLTDLAACEVRALRGLPPEKWTETQQLLNTAQAKELLEMAEAYPPIGMALTRWLGQDAPLRRADFNIASEARLALMTLKKLDEDRGSDQIQAQALLRSSRFGAQMNAERLDALLPKSETELQVASPGARL